MQDPQHKGVGFYDVNDVDSIVRAIKNDAGMRLFNSIQVREGKQPNTTQVERDLHNKIMMQHYYIAEFKSVKELWDFVVDYKPENDSQECIKDIMMARIPTPVEA